MKKENSEQPNSEKPNSEQPNKRRVSFMPDPKVDYVYKERVEENEVSSDITVYCQDEDSCYEKEIEEIFSKNDICGERIESDEEDLLPEYERKGWGNGRMSMDPLKYTLEKIKNDSLIERNTITERNQTTKNYLNQNSENQIMNTASLRSNSKINTDEYLSGIGIRFLDKVLTEMGRRETISKSTNTVELDMKDYYKESLLVRIKFFRNSTKFLSEKMEDMQRQIDNIDIKSNLERYNVSDLKKLRNECRNRSKIEWYNYRRAQETQFNQLIQTNKNKLLKKLHELEKIEEEKVKKRNELIERNRKTEERIKMFKMKIRNLKVDSNDNAHVNDSVHVNVDVNDNNMDNSKDNNIDKNMDNSLDNNIDDSLDNYINNNFYHKIQESKISSDRISLLRQKLENLKKEYEIEETKKIEKEVEERIILNRINDLKKENRKLEGKIKLKNVTEKDLNEIKDTAKMYESVFKFKIKKNRPNLLVFSMNDYDFSCKIQNGGILQFSIENTIINSFRQFSMDYFIQNCDLFDTDNISEDDDNDNFDNTVSLLEKPCLSLCIRMKKQTNLKEFIYFMHYKINLLDAIRIEIQKIEEENKIECFYSKEKYHMKICNFKKSMLEFHINILLEIIYNGSAIVNLQKELGGLTKFVTEHL